MSQTKIKCLNGRWILSAGLAVALASTVVTSLEAQSRDLTGKVVLANADKHKVTFRAGKTQKNINPGKASILSPRQFPISFELWSGDSSVKWKPVTINEPGVYVFRFSGGQWQMTKRNPRARPATASRTPTTSRRYNGHRTYQRGVGSRPRVVQRGGGNRVVINNPRFRRPWRGRYWHPISRGIWTVGWIYDAIRDEALREEFRRWIIDGEIDDAVREEIEDRIWDAIKDDAVNLPADELDELERSWDDLKDITDEDWKEAVNLPADEWDQIRDNLKDDITDEDWKDLQEGVGEIGDTMDVRDEDIDNMDEVGIDDLEQNVDLNDLDGADLG
ncbi:MAG: hypothetical protein ACR2NP_07220, partial [Pirellulaceae bacterium]